MKDERKSPSDLATEFIECRGPLGHAWFGVIPPRPRRGTLGAVGRQESFVCERCRKLRHEVWSRTTGQLLSRKYVNPPGFAPIGREHRYNDLRLELLKRYRKSRPQLKVVDYSEPVQ